MLLAILRFDEYGLLAYDLCIGTLPMLSNVLNIIEV